MAYVYILQGTSGRTYIGSAENVERAVERHNAGYLEASQRMGLPMRLLASRSFATITEARQIEALFRRWDDPKRVITFLSKPD